MELQETKSAQTAPPCTKTPGFCRRLAPYLLLAGFILILLGAAAYAMWLSPLLKPIAELNPDVELRDYASRIAVLQFVFSLLALVVAFAVAGAAVVPHAFNSSLPPLSNRDRTPLDWAATFAGAMLFAALALGVASVCKNVVHPNWGGMTADTFDMAEKIAGYLVASVGASLPLGALTAKWVNKQPRAAS